MEKYVFGVIFTSLLLVSLGVIASNQLAQKQVVYLDAQDGLVAGWYRADNELGPGATGIGIRLHYSSGEGSLSLNNLYQKGLVGVSDQADTNDYDADPRTDRFIKLAWVSPMGDWGERQPLMLFDIVKNTSQHLTVTASDVAVGYTFEFVPEESE